MIQDALDMKGGGIAKSNPGQTALEFEIIRAVINALENDC